MLQSDGMTNSFLFFFPPLPPSRFFSSFSLRHVQEDAFVSGRTAVLRKFTERSSLYFTDAFKGLDNLAKRNLKAEMESLARNL